MLKNPLNLQPAISYLVWPRCPIQDRAHDPNFTMHFKFLVSLGLSLLFLLADAVDILLPGFQGRHLEAEVVGQVGFIQRTISSQLTTI